MSINRNYHAIVYKVFVYVISEAVAVLSIVNYKNSESNGQVAALIRGLNHGQY